QPAHREVAATSGAMLGERLQRIRRTRRLEAAGRPQPGAEEQPVALDHTNEQTLHQHGADTLAGPATAGEAVGAPPPGRRLACAKSCCSSARTARRSGSDAALTNCLRSKPARKRTTWAASGVA